MVEFLIDKEASVRAVDKMKRTALMLAIKHESPEIVRLLLQQGVDILSEDVCGWTAEEYAAVSSFNIFRHLISEYKEKKPKTSPEKSNPADESSEEDSSRRFPNEPGVDLGPPSNNEVLDFKTKHVLKPKLTKLMKTSQQSNRNIEAKCGILRPESTTFSEDNNSDRNIEDVVETFPKPSPWFEGICQPAFPSPEPVPKLLKSVAGLGPTKVKEQIDYVNDLDDLTQSSETVSEDGDMLYSTNSTLQVEPLDVGCKDSVRKLKIRDTTLSHETLIDFQRSHCELLRGAPHKLKSKGCGLQKELSESEEVKSQLEHQKAEWERELGSLRFTLKKEEKNRRNANMLNEKIREQLRKEDKYSKEVETTTRTHSPSTQNGTADYEK
ncbi:ankyrin repeat domain-containing protein 62-like isoform X2 [Muntiacus reevesi]